MHLVYQGVSHTKGEHTHQGIKVKLWIDYSAQNNLLLFNTKECLEFFEGSHVLNKFCSKMSIIALES